MSRSD